MIRTIEIKNYKSIDQLTLQLGRVNVFIGENGCGKTNILEAIGLAAAAAANKLDNEFLHSRGIRVTSPDRMRSGFDTDSSSRNIEVSLHASPDQHYFTTLEHEGGPFGAWVDLSIDRYRVIPATPPGRGWRVVFADDNSQTQAYAPSDEASQALMDAIIQENCRVVARAIRVDEFLTYTPHEEALRDLARDSWIEPVGIHGEGLFALLQSLGAAEFAELKQHLALIHWFADLEILPGATPSQHSLKIVDQYLADGLAHFDQRSANEGFLFLLLYACLLVSQHTPRFFAVDNVDTSLNPKLAAGAVRVFTELCRKHDRQVLLTTHNPGTLDGLDLNDDEQRLFVVYRNLEGRTRVRRIERDSNAKDPVRLSESFLRGYLGGLPNHF